MNESKKKSTGKDATTKLNQSPGERNSADDVAIIGFAFRFPGDYCDEDNFWNALIDQKDLVSSVPEDRWATKELQHDKRSEPGRSVTFSAGVLSRIGHFDAGFFGISSREAAWLDPQQRLLLELSWEAMENAGIVPSSIAGSDCAVYVGVSGLDYGTRGLDDLASLSPHIMTGNTLSIVANRISYIYDFHGPSLAVDTACSSSLVALHQACESLRRGESSTALVGGVNALLHPYPFVGFSKAFMLSEDGRCKPFDESANGYVRSEGGAVLMLKKLDKALADGDDIQAVVSASGINSDGARKTGITIPSSDGQSELMRKVLAKSGFSSNDVDYIEAHGTGTAVGDPIEAAAIGSVYGAGRSKPLPIGSVKANLGHMEPASGMAGLVKTLLVLKNRGLPPAMHFKTPNQHIDFAGLNLDLVTHYRELQKEPNKPLIAGVNSFGFGGSNAHVLLREHLSWEKQEASTLVKKPVPLFLSARSEDAMRSLAGRYAALLRTIPPTEFYSVAYAAAYRREHMEKRLALFPLPLDEAVAALSRFAEGESPDKIVTEDKLPQDGSVAFVYSGNGAQWVGMGRRLLDESPRFREIVSELDVKILPLAGFSVIEELKAESQTARLDDTVVAQPLLFTIQVASTLLLKELGVEPAGVTGHSVGEVAASWASGALDLDQAIRVIVERSAAQGKTRGNGRMAAVGMSEAAVTDVLKELDANDVTVAGINSPKNVTLSGSQGALERIQKRLESENVFFRLLDLDYAFHSWQMDPIQETLEEKLADLEPSVNQECHFVSTVTGDSLCGSSLDAGYWWQNVRQPVRFETAIIKLIDLGCRVFIEIGPHAILHRYISECVTAADIEARVVPLLRKGHDGQDQIIHSALRCHLLAHNLKRDVFYPSPGHRVRLPNYPWQREQHWHPNTTEGLAVIARRRVHPLLGWRLFDAEMSWENTIDSTVLPWLGDHKIGGAVVFPGSAYAELGLAAAKEWQGGEYFVVEQINIVAPMVFVGEHSRTIRLIVNPRDGGFQVKSRQRLSKDEWTLHAVGRILEATGRQPSSCLESITEPKKEIWRETHYKLTAALGLDYGPAFQGLEQAHIREDKLEATLDSQETLGLESGYLIHPAILDVCSQSLVDFFQADIEAGLGVAFLPVKIGRIEVYSQNPIKSFSACLRHRGPRSVLGDFELFDAEKKLVAKATECRFRAAPLQYQGKLQISRWNIASRLCPHPLEGQVTEFPTAKDVVGLLRAGLAEISSERRNWFNELFPLGEALILSFAYEVFGRHSKESPDGIQSLMKKGTQYVRWLGSLLWEEGLIREESGRWILVENSDIPAAAEIWHTMLRDYPSCLPFLTYTCRIGGHLPELLSGEILGEELWDSVQHSPAVETLIDHDEAYLGTKQAIEYAMQELTELWPPNRRLRVLEINVGPSELPRILLGKMPEDKLDYVLALPDERNGQRAQITYQEFRNFTVANFNQSEWEFVAETSLPQAYDVILVRHVLHKAENPERALSQVRNSLASGGTVILAERFPDWSADFLAGLHSGWWHESEDPGSGSISHPLSSLAPPDVWMDLFNKGGFEAPETIIESEEEGVLAGAYLLIARHSLTDAKALPEPEAASWQFVVDESSNDIAGKLVARFENNGQQVVVTEQKTLCDTGGVAGQNVVYAAGWNCQPENVASLLADLLQKVQVLGAITPHPPKLWIITQGGALADGLSRNPVQAAIWGFGRVIMNEYPGLNCTLVDLTSDAHGDEIFARLENELIAQDNEREIVLAPEGRFVLDMHEKEPISPNYANRHSRFRLDFQVPGKLQNLLWVPVEENDLRDDQVEVQTQATGLNFRDVMYLMGLLPDEAVESGFSGASLGLEFSGIVSRVGSAVSDIQPGDKVMGFGSHCFASHVVTTAGAVMPIPENWSFEAAATVPTVYFSVYYALHHLADLQQGERVLIHGAAGGVGIAAIQLARHIGAEIFATAGSDEKRDFVRLLGADHVFDSRSLDFADDILAVTDGEGVDVVLNSLAGEAIRRNLSVLRPFGRFLELGKRDFYENTPIGLRSFKDNISYFGIDVDQLFLGRPRLALRLYQELMVLFREGVLTPLPYRVYKAEQIVDAFHEMREARHIGKVVVSMADAMPHISKAVRSAKQVHLENESTWLVTGGLDGFGLESARWLVSRGVGNLALVSRRGEKTPGAIEAITHLQEQGVNIKAMACDVTDKDQLASVIADIRNTMPPLKGVLHAAMVMDDRLITNLDQESLETVLNPKFGGAWNLHLLTQDMPLEYFVLYSSITTAIGNPGQANYVAANAALEGLAQMRSREGLPATSVGWGPIGDVGYLTRNTEVKKNLGHRLGKPPLSAVDALDQLDDVLIQKQLYCFIANFDWGVLSSLLPSAGFSRFERLNRIARASGGAAQHTDIHSLIAHKSPEELKRIVCEFVIHEVANVLLVKAERIDANCSLHDLGLDSLMAVELAQGLEKRFGIQLPVMMFNESPTANRVASCIVEKLSGNTETEDISPTESVVKDLARQHGEDMTESEVEYLVKGAASLSKIGEGI